jgi:hypothetical protein
MVEGWASEGHFGDAEEPEEAQAAHCEEYRIVKGREHEEVEELQDVVVGHRDTQLRRRGLLGEASPDQV